MTILSGHHEPDSEPPGYFRSAVPDLANLNADPSLGRVDLESMRSSWSIAPAITVAQRFRGAVQRTFLHTSRPNGRVFDHHLPVGSEATVRRAAGWKAVRGNANPVFAGPLQYGGNECAPED